ncbi:zinc-dependent metalloprotease [Prevotella sp. E13-17]|uniref:zinc-dependent metalloprotease n=1 Tax=Prevotella sp. E13-17 TaxID=2913616 RepID=UPI001EDA6E6F|nr:zinc-dependent metalloprotease [Prevotella sp. E13-17]UKK50007.1 zinc-dependent metalloprotease [Prevotella sp. E13-17]
MAKDTKEKKEKAKTEQKVGKKVKKTSFSLFKKKKKEMPQRNDSVKVEKPLVDREGLFHVTKEKNDWFFQIPDSLIGRQFLTTTRFTSTPASSGIFGGEQVNEQTVYFQKGVDNQLLLRANLIINVADSVDKISRAITISNENPIIGSFRIESHKNGKYKIKVTQFFNQDNVAMALPQYVKKQFELQAMRGDMSYIEDIKSFPMNTEVRTVKTFASMGRSLPSAASTGLVTFGLNISFVLLPEKPMMRRYFDPRVGYFTDRFNSYSDDQQRVESKTFITRWRLEPRPEDVEKMKNGELVEPAKPIIYYIDPATPKQWRKYLIMGVEDWQKAFEKAGFKNAIQAREWPENDSTMSMEDARYSCIRYLASPIANAYGPNVHDPRTGEILESHICWYHNVMSLVHDWYMIQASSIDEAAQKMNYDEELMGQLIRFVSSHEVGHTLGLRHNFGSSSTVPVENLRNKAWVEAHGHTPSIMDYARFNYVAQPEDGISREGIFPRIGDYDMWAITWGYKPMLDAKDELEDHKMLEPMVLESLKNRRLWWGDGEGEHRDPRRQTEDLGDDAVKASYYGILNLKRLAKNLPEYIKDDEKDIYGNDLSTMYNQIQMQFYRYCGHVARNIGGYLVEPKTQGMEGNKFEPQPLAKQKAALKFLDEQVLHEPMWLRDMSYAKRLITDPQYLSSSIGEPIMTMMMNRLFELNELYSAQQYLSDLSKLVFAELNTGRKISSYRMALQKSMLSSLISINNSNNNVVRPAVLYTLQQLQKKAKVAAASATDTESRAHYAYIYDQIGRQLVWK